MNRRSFGTSTITFHEGAVTTKADLKRAFQDHVTYTLQDTTIKWPDDDSHIKKAGYTVDRVQMCKVCSLPALKKNCGAHYDVKNRSVKVTYGNMKLTTLKTDEY